MKIVPTFATQNKREGLFAIRIDNENEDELAKCLDNWFDTEYLYNFFSENITDLNSGYYKETISVREAIKLTKIEAEQLFQKLEDLAIKGVDSDYNNLSSAFQALNNNEYTTKTLQQVKTRGDRYQTKGWLRIYAIKISANTFIITGGAIKIVRAIQDKEYLIKEKQKLDNIKIFLTEQGIFDQQDFEVYILSI